MTTLTFKDDNAKFGKGICYISIDRKYSCRGASAICQQVCYGDYNRFAWWPLIARYLRHYKLSKAAHFADDILASLQRLHPVAFRIHDVGDFYSTIYIRKWLTIVQNRRDIRFFAYTRGWTVPELVLSLAQLAAEPNVTMFLSLDNSMPYDQIPPELAGLPRAWLATTDDDIPPPRLNVAVVFRNLRNTITPLDNSNHFGAMVCLGETGRGKVTCRDCRFCWARWKETQLATSDTQSLFHT